MEIVHEEQTTVKKRPLEQARPEFVATDDGAYHVLEMPKRILRCGGGQLTANPRRQPRSHLLPSDDEHAASGDEAKKKRSLELEEPEFVVKEDGGAYCLVEMSKRYKFPGYIDGEDARTEALAVRTIMVTNAYIREQKAKAAARGAAS